MGIDYSSPKIRVLIQGAQFFARGVLRAATGTYLSLPRMGGDQEDSPEEEYMNQIIEGLLEVGRRASQAKEMLCIPPLVSLLDLLPSLAGTGMFL